MRIDVTQEDIDGADGTDSENCMVYRAMKRVIPELHSVGVLAFHVHDPHRWGEVVSVMLPPWVARRISSHFLSIAQTPFSFEVDYAPRPSID